MNALSLLNLTRTTTPVIQQAESSECGLACLAMVAGYHGYDVSLLSLRRRFPISLKGTTIKTLMAIAEALNLETRALKVDIDQINDLQIPAIIHWNFNHFVVLVEIKHNGKRFVLHDPSKGVMSCTKQEFSQSYTGVALEMAPTIDFEKKNDHPKLRVIQLWTSTKGAISAFGHIIIISLLLQAVILAAPFYMQTAIDSALPFADSGLLAILALGFGGLAIVNAVASWLRGRLLLHIAQALTFQMVSNLVRHMLRLPLAWFEKRQIGDVISRFSSTMPISDLLTKGLIAGVVDGLMAIITLFLMIAYSPALALLAVGSLSIIALIRLGLLPIYNRHNRNAIGAQAIEQSVIIESLHGIAAIKAFNQESDRFRLWRDKKASAINASIKVGRIRNITDIGEQAVIDFESVAFVFIAVSMIMLDQITIGMVFAFVAYKTQFLKAGSKLVLALGDYRALDVHLERISEIALGEAEVIVSSSRKDSTDGDLEVRGLRYSYGIGEPEILTDVNFTIATGQSLAITGPSGGGKTTLIKLILGLLEPTHGAILIDGRPLTRGDFRSWRAQVGYVAQDDSLYGGSIADNIAFFDSEIDFDRVEQVAKIAIIHDDITRMPMGYSTYVGDMGSALSGGQKARVLLARALYRNPRMLFIDEGTANLDILTEVAVNTALSELGITKIIIAHRPETIASADHVLQLVNGRLVS